MTPSEGPPHIHIPWPRPGEKEKRIVNAPVDGEAHVYHLDLSTTVVESYTDKRPTWLLIEDPARGLWWRLGYFDLDQLIWHDGINASKDTIRALITRKPFGQGGARTKTIIHEAKPIDLQSLLNYLNGGDNKGGSSSSSLLSLSSRGERGADDPEKADSADDPDLEKSFPPPTPQSSEQISAPSDDVQEDEGVGDEEEWEEEE